MEYYVKALPSRSLRRSFEHSIQAVQALLDLLVLNVDGSHVVAKKGGEAVGYQDVSAPGPATFCPSPTTTAIFWRRRRLAQATPMTPMHSSPICKARSQP